MCERFFIGSVIFFYFEFRGFDFSRLRGLGAVSGVVVF